ncbi:MlaE family ABC transporter permease [Haliovirga abyssi]|uniref:ABC transporter permease n=1 Tax=Haliovirga abyssi TaxID=2996794 RepID=A0AAU9DA71_9FUSO|nr:ABC transporter permease [Haliovirga abyssi]BDU50230.1 ABC transporter permease [Haliovirga abyssi]
MVFFFEKLGAIFIFLMKALVGVITYFFNKNKLIKKSFIEQIYSIGVLSFPMVAIVSIFMGMVMIIQLVPAFKEFGAESFVSGAVSLAITRELGPVITALIMAGRVGSAITAELGSMKVTEQISALEVMAVDPISYLVSPRIFAGMIMLPLLSIISDVFSIFGGYFIGVYATGLVSGIYFSNMRLLITSTDIFGGVLKALFFGIIIAAVSSYKGINVKGGAEEVGKATTDSVVISIVLILIFNFFLSYLIFAQ